MCGLFGFLRYGNDKINLDTLTESLAVEAAIRGTDATGVAYNDRGRLRVYKKPVSAYRMDFDLPNVRALVGHTRHATQGDIKHNYNNHPFLGRAGKAEFALAHNGVIINDTELRDTLNLPRTKIETDSYIAVQLIESKRVLDMSSLAYTAEKVHGSYSFSVLDKRNNIYLVKGDSPISILHFPERKLYVYASTVSILWKALVDTDLFKELKAGAYKEIPIKNGEILNLCSNGRIERGTFKYKDCDYYYDWRNYGIGSQSYFDSNMYIDDIKSLSGGFGYDETDIDDLLRQGYTPDEIAEYLYGVEV